MPELKTVEEYVENEGTGVEAEVTGDAGQPKPWDPDKIRIHDKTYSLRQIVDQITDGEIDLAPDFQRNQVWRLEQKSRLIESILLGIPMPAFYFNENRDGLMQVVDGVQRLSTIRDFAGTKTLALRGLEYLTKFEKAHYDDLDPVFRRRFNNTQIHVNVIDPQTPEEVKYDVFRRINTGGTPLNAQEIRHCMSGPRSRAFLKRCAEAPAFNEATDHKLESHVRMIDREFVLRFCAFRLLPLDEYTTFDSFLRLATERLDSAQELTDLELEELFESFVTAMENAHRLFDRQAFRKWTQDDVVNKSKMRPLNRALFETWSVALAKYSWEQLEPHKDKIVGRSQALFVEDPHFVEAITTSTGDRQRVAYRFQAVNQVLVEAGC